MQEEESPGRTASMQEEESPGYANNQPRLMRKRSSLAKFLYVCDILGPSLLVLLVCVCVRLLRCVPGEVEYF